MNQVIRCVLSENATHLRGPGPTPKIRCCHEQTSLLQADAGWATGEGFYVRGKEIRAPFGTQRNTRSLQIGATAEFAVYGLTSRVAILSRNLRSEKSGVRVFDGSDHG
jgi:hypothetical protein